MVFSSYTFLCLFLPWFLLLYYGAALLGRVGLAHRVGTTRTLLLITASYVFYGWERYWYVLLILFSTVIDFVCAGAIARSTSAPRRRALLVVSIVTNLGLLGFFKYRHLLFDSISFGLFFAGEEPLRHLWPGLVLPVGISFYTFQSMSYTIDVYRGSVVPVPRRRFLDFMSYVSLFPQLVAGPIVRFSDIAEQLAERHHTLEKAARGAFLLMLGFAKKILIANNVGSLADSLFATPEPGLVDAWCGTLAYTMQIYFDFSGYSDMAIGLGLLIGFVFPRNFESPYRAESITDFWRRWHITLSSWLRDYLYIPLGGNRKGAARTYVNLILTMLLGGLWHGASWTFVLWGAWHGGLLALERWRGAGFATWPRPARVAITLVLVMIGWIMFRATTLDALVDVMGGFFGAHGIGSFTLRGPHAAQLPLVALVAGASIAFFGPTALALAQRLTWPRVLMAGVVFTASVVQMILADFNPFLYYQF